MELLSEVGADSRSVFLPLRTDTAALPWAAPAGIAERLFALALLWMLLPGLIVAALSILLLSRRSPLIAHARVGKGGDEIWVFKLRTMWGPAVRPWENRFLERVRAEPGTAMKRADDPRISSRLAAVYRRYSIDELPQLWNVVRGELSLIGPRPMTHEELARHYGSAAAEVLRIKPGLTGLWQVRGRSSLHYRQRRRLDLFLVRRRSARLYAGILLATIPKVLTGQDAW